MRWLALCTPLRYLLFGLAVYLLYLGTEEPDWMSAPQEFALEWRTTLDRYSDPESAQAQHRGLAMRRFSDNEWIVGICRESAGIRDGGAFVVKDSTGQTRVFLGPGCVSSTLADVMHDAKSLADFYRHETWTILQYKEYVLE